MRGSESVFARVKEEVRLAELFRDAGHQLRRSGENWSCLCPFHPDKNPSCVVYRDHYKCYACQAHGDAVAFWSQKTGASPLRAAVELAERYRVRVNGSVPSLQDLASRPARGPASLSHPAGGSAFPARTGLVVETSHRDSWPVEEGLSAREVSRTQEDPRVYAEREAFARAAFLELLRFPGAYAKALSLGFSARSVLLFGLGYASSRLMGVWASRPLATASGLLQGEEGQSLTPSYHLAERLVVPYRDAEGRVVTFEGRAFGNLEAKVKYASARGFSKAAWLFEPRAWGGRPMPALVASGQAFIFESVKCAMNARSLGLEAWACGGTGSTRAAWVSSLERQALLGRLRFNLAFDNDLKQTGPSTSSGAGALASARFAGAWDSLVRAGLLYVCDMGLGELSAHKDFSDALLARPDAAERLRECALPAAEWMRLRARVLLAVGWRPVGAERRWLAPAYAWPARGLYGRKAKGLRRF